MLPAVLSNGCCSLSGGEERYTLSVAVTLNEKGERVKASLFPSVIRSSLRGVYSEANYVLESGKKSPFYEKYSAVADTLSLMWELACLLKKKRTASGAVELAEDEAAIMLGEDGSPVDVVRIERGKTERIIEQFMLGDVSAGVHVAGAAFKFAYIAVGVEWICCGHWNRSE